MGHSQPKLNISCAACGHSIPCYDPKHSTHFGCSYCGYFFKKEDNEPEQVIIKFSRDERYKPAIPLGASGILDGKRFTVVGFVRKSDDEHEAYWNEYFLYNSNHSNYHVLVEYDGHWTLVWDKNLDEYKVYNIGTRFLPRYEVRSYTPLRRFKHYVSYKFEIPWAIGEFDWNLLEEAGNMYVEEYIDPPNVIVSEEIYDRKQWYWGRYIQPDEIASAFSLERRHLPLRMGRGALEPSSHSINAAPLARFTFGMIVLVVVTQLMINLFKTPRTVLNSSYGTTKDTSAWAAVAPIVTEPFKITGSGGVNIDIGADIDNSWMEVSVSLVNNSTGKTYEVTKSLEYYHGYESGESWSEGSRSESLVLSNVPKGTYHLNIYPYSESKELHNIVVSVEENTAFYSNMVWMLFIVILVPAFRSMVSEARKNRYFE